MARSSICLSSWPNRAFDSALKKQFPYTVTGDTLIHTDITALIVTMIVTRRWKISLSHLYLHARRKRRLKLGGGGGGFLGITFKKVVPCRCLDWYAKEPYEMSTAWEPDRRCNFSSPQYIHVCRHIYGWNIVHCNVKQPIHMYTRNHDCNVIITNLSWPPQGLNNISKGD